MTDRKTNGPAISADIYGTVLTFTGSDGTEVRVDAALLSESVRHAAMMHGLKQKIGDAAALSRNPDTGRSATVADKMAAMEEVAARLRAGGWNKDRDGTGSTGVGGLLFRALCIQRPSMDPARIREWLAGKDKKEQAKLRDVPDIARIIVELRAKDAATAPTNADADLFAGLDDNAG